MSPQIALIVDRLDEARPAIEPGLRLLELCCQSIERGLIVPPTHELNPDRRPSSLLDSGTNIAGSPAAFAGWDRKRRSPLRGRDAWTAGRIEVRPRGAASWLDSGECDLLSTTSPT